MKQKADWFNDFFSMLQMVIVSAGIDLLVFQSMLAKTEGQETGLWPLSELSCYLIPHTARTDKPTDQVWEPAYRVINLFTDPHRKDGKHHAPSYTVLMFLVWKGLSKIQSYVMVLYECYCCTITVLRPGLKMTLGFLGPMIGDGRTISIFGKFGTMYPVL
jgi:hypothetical protein